MYSKFALCRTTGTKGLLDIIVLQIFDYLPGNFMVNPNHLIFHLILFPVFPYTTFCSFIITTYVTLCVLNLKTSQVTQ